MLFSEFGSCCCYGSVGGSSRFGQDSHDDERTIEVLSEDAIGRTMFFVRFAAAGIYIYIYGLMEKFVDDWWSALIDVPRVACCPTSIIVNGDRDRGCVFCNARAQLNLPTTTARTLLGNMRTVRDCSNSICGIVVMTLIIGKRLSRFEESTFFLSTYTSKSIYLPR